MPHADSIKKREYDLLYREKNRKKLNEIHKAWKKKNPEKIKHYNKLDKERNPDRYKKYRKKNKEKIAKKVRECKLKNRYGLTLLDFNKILESQNNLCPICKKDFLGSFHHVDHDHLTGKVRGILHMVCNTMLGKAKDDIEILQNAIDYLRKSK